MNNFCACVGKMNDEPHCPCVMRRYGLATSFDVWTEEQIKQLEKMFDEDLEGDNNESNSLE